MLPLAALLLQACGAKGGVDAQAGQRIFESRCASCHKIGPYASSGFAPQLNGIVGRKAGSIVGFNYSPALRASTLVWTEQNLRAFVRGPQAVVPGTSMRFWGIGDETQAASLLAYLRTVH